MLDTNVILDFALRREPFFEDAEQVLLLTEQRENIEFVSSSAVTDIFYMLRRYYGDSFKAQEVLSSLRKIVTILEVSDRNIKHALDLHWHDFEDAVQYATAERIQADFIITRNVRDFRQSKVVAFTPSEFLARI